jgi:light-regulated signal transduction histidine kinase (bacteriophytochrome)
MADATQLGQLFQNLVGNALKFRQPDRRPEVSIAAHGADGEVVFSVSDNGIGIEERFLDKIFGVFQRLHTRDEYEGSGIGLALCRKIVLRHGGRIWAESELGKGTTFRFALRPAPAEKGVNA